MKKPENKGGGGGRHAKRSIKLNGFIIEFGLTNGRMGEGLGGKKKSKKLTVGDIGCGRCMKKSIKVGIIGIAGRGGAKKSMKVGILGGV